MKRVNKENHWEWKEGYQEESYLPLACCIFTSLMIPFWSLFTGFTSHPPNKQRTVSVEAKNTRSFMVRTTSAHFRSGNYIRKGSSKQNYSCYLSQNSICLSDCLFLEKKGQRCAAPKQLRLLTKQNLHLHNSSEQAIWWEQTAPPFLDCYFDY